MSSMSIRHVHISVGTRSARDWENFLQVYEGPDYIYKMVDMDVDTDSGKLRAASTMIPEHIAGTDKQGKKKEWNLRVTGNIPQD